VFVVDYAHDEAELLIDFTQDRDDVRDAILEKMIAGGGTPLFDSLYLALDHITRGKFERKAIVVISDGEDKDSHYDYRDVLAKIRSSEVQIYFIALQRRRTETLFDLDDASRAAAGRGMAEMSDLSGGRLFVPEDLQALDQVTADLATELRHQYRIGFHPTAVPPQAGFRRLEVKLNLPGNFKIHTRRGYFHTGK
jgi:Ca-activated chloride channel family protein